MSQTQSDKPVLIIVGMHRSGTSFVASLLQSAGLFIGDRLLPANEGNSKGYFENQDFYDLHRAILRSQGINEAGWTLQENITIEDFYREQAKQIVEQHQSFPCWGWKEPRTTLFLDFWANLLPNARFLMVYRAPWDVVDSLYRRGDPIFHEHPDLAVKIWLHYNQKILDFCDRYPQRCLVVNPQTVPQHTNLFLEAITTQFEIALTPPDYSLYDASLLNSLPLNSHRPSLIAQYFPEAIDLYQQLDQRAWHLQSQLLSCWRELLEATPYRTWVFQDWMNNRQLQRKIKEIIQSGDRAVDPENRAHLQAQLWHTETALQQTQEKLLHTEAMFAQSQSLLKGALDDATVANNKVGQTQAELELTQTQLDETEKTLQHFYKQVEVIEAVFAETQAQLQEQSVEMIQLQAQQRTLEATLFEAQNQLRETLDELAQVKQEKQTLEETLALSEKQLGQTAEQLSQARTEKQQTQKELKQTQDLFRQTEAVLEQSQEQLHETESVLAEMCQHLEQATQALEQATAQQQQTQTELKQTRLELDATGAELEQSQLQVMQTKAIVTQLQDQLQSTETVLSQHQEQLHHTEGILEESQVYLQQTTTELEQTRDQLRETEKALVQSEAQLQDRENDLSQSRQELQQSHEQFQQTSQRLAQSQAEEKHLQKSIAQIQIKFDHTQQDLLNTQAELNQTQAKLAQANTQLQQVQKQWERLTFEQSIKNEGDSQKVQYKLCVWEAWYAYQANELNEMAVCLRRSMQYSSLSDTEVILDWIKNFHQFCSKQNLTLNVHQLTQSREWQQVVQRATKPKLLTQTIGF